VWFQHDTYSRDAVGRVTGIDDNGFEAVDAPSNVDECFLYDQWNRLIGAHSVVADGTCATTTATLSTGSRDAYDMVWTFDDINRMRNSKNMTAVGTPTTTYGYAGTKHAVTGLTGATTGSYGYNAAGAMTTRGGDGLTYDTQQRLTGYAAGEEYVYTTTNQRLIRRAGGTRTLYLPGMEVSVTGTTRTINCYLTIGATQVGTQTVTTGATSLMWACGNMQNSNVCQVTAGSGATPSRKRYAPYGASRQTAPVTFANTDRGFPNNPTTPTASSTSTTASTTPRSQPSSASTHSSTKPGSRTSMPMARQHRCQTRQVWPRAPMTTTAGLLVLARVGLRS